MGIWLKIFIAKLLLERWNVRIKFLFLAMDWFFICSVILVRSCLLKMLHWWHLEVFSELPVSSDVILRVKNSSFRANHSHGVSLGISGNHNRFGWIGGFQFSQVMHQLLGGVKEDMNESSPTPESRLAKNINQSILVILCLGWLFGGWSSILIATSAKTLSRNLEEATLNLKDSLTQRFLALLANIPE